MLLKQAIDQYLHSARANGLSLSTIKWYRSVLGKFGQRFGDCIVEGIGVETLRDYIVDLREKESLYQDAPQRPQKAGGYSIASINGHITGLHAFWGWCAREYDIANPMNNVRRPKRVKPEPKAVNASDFIKLFEATADNPLGARDRLLLALLAESGARIGAIMGLCLKHINLKEHSARVIEKGRKPHTIYFTNYTAALMSYWLEKRAVLAPQGEDGLWLGKDGHALNISGANQILKRLKKRAGIEGRANPHAFRHAFAREYIKAGGDVVTLARLMGHDDVNTTAAYYAVFNDDELKAMHHERSPLKRMFSTGD